MDNNVYGVLNIAIHSLYYQTFLQPNSVELWICRSCHQALLIFTGIVHSRIGRVFLRVFLTNIKVVVERNGNFVLLNKDGVYLVNYLAIIYNNLCFYCILFTVN